MAEPEALRLAEALERHAADFCADPPPALFGIAAAELRRLGAENPILQDCIESLKADLAERDAEIALLRADARRWRWIRERPEWIGWDQDFRPDEVEREVDAAMNQIKDTP